MDDAKLRDELLKFIKEKAIQKGDFTLASGKKTNYYIDGKQVTLDPQGLFLASKVIYSMIHSTQADAIGGPTLGADPIAAAVALLSSQSGHPVRAFIVRKESKAHGMLKKIEGPKLQEGDKVVMVEDVITTGASVLKAIEAVESCHARVVKVICLVDRNQGASETLGKFDYSPIFDLRDLGLS